jgi:hypothetical protein
MAIGDTLFAMTTPKACRIESSGIRGKIRSEKVDGNGVEFGRDALRLKFQVICSTENRFLFTTKPPSG